MRILKLALISFAVLFSIIFLFSLMIPSRVRVSRAVNVHQRDVPAARRLATDTAWWKGGLPPLLAVHRHAGSDSVTVQAYSDFHSGYLPWKKFRSLFYEDTYGAFLEERLEAFRMQLEGSGHPAFDRPK